MSQTDSPTSDNFDDHAATRERMRRDILRAHTAVALVLVAVLALALVAVFAALRAEENLRRAKAAEAEGRERLLRAYVAQARARRTSAEPGGRRAALEAITNAAAIRPSSDVRTEAIGCLALSDLEQDGPIVPTRPDLERVLTDDQLRYYVSVGESNRVLLYSLRDGKLSEAIPLDGLVTDARKELSYLAFSPDGTVLAARFIDGGITAWKLDSKQQVFSHGIRATNAPPPGRSFRLLTGISFSRDSKKLIFNDGQADGQISIYDVASAHRESSAIPVWGKIFRMAPGLDEVAVANGVEVDILDYPAGRVQHSLVHESVASMLAWSAKGDLLAVSCDDGAIYLWDLKHNIHRHLSGHSELCVRLGFSPDGKLLFSGSRDGTTRLWDVAQGRQIAAGEGLGHMISEDGTKVGFWRPWEGFGTWRISQSTVYTTLACDNADGPLLTLDLSASGRWCVVTQNKGMRIWDLNSACAATSLREPDVVCAVVSPDEKSLYMCGGKGMATRRLDAAPSVPSRKIPLPDNVGGRSLSVSLDGRWAAIELRDYRLFSIDLTGKMAPVEMQGHYRSVSFRGAASVTGSGRYAISPDGRWIVTGNDFNGDNPQVWDARSGQLAARLNASTSVVGFSADGQRLGLAGREQSSIWSVGDWKLIKVFPRDEPSLVNGALAFAQGHSLLATERTRQSVQLRNGNTFDKLADLISPTVQSVNSLRVASDGSTLATSTPGGMVEIWRLNDLRRQLAAMGLDWGSEPVGPDEVPQGDSGSSRITIILVMATFMLAATLILLTLRRHRVAIERFVTAEAQAAQQDRELNAAKVELVRSQKMQALGTLAVGIAHDFNNLLSVVRMSSKLIGRQAGDSRDIQEHVADIEHAVLQGKQVVSSMLGYARPGHAMGEPTDASAVVADTVSLLSKEFLSGITLILEQAPAAPKVRLDRGPLEQILLNLVVNASEAMQGAGKLKITVRACLTLPSHDYVLQPGKAEGYVEMSVIDTGPGISPDIRDRLFEPFFTTKRSSARVGTGLGLSLVYSIARQNELGLAVESEPGRGAMFCLVMPVVPNGVRETHTAPQARNV